MVTPSVPTEEIVDLSPFKRMVMTIGTLPTAFTESMTYYEALAYFTKYLEETVIPAINQNGEATKELQRLFTELKSYVDNYFDDLDVQTEINNKLDAMVTDGTLDRIINQEIFGELNQTIEEIQSDVTSIGAATSTNTSSITSLSNSVDSRVATLQQKDNDLQSGIDTVQTSVNSAIAAQNAQIAQITGGLPTIVSSTSAMSDRSKIYVLSSNMHIYTYNTTSGSFEDSGIIYGGSSSAITNNEQLIYANNYAALLPDFNTVPINKIYHLNFSTGATNIPAHMPFSTYSGGVGKLTTYSINSALTTGAIQIYENRQYRWIRTGTGANTWAAWMRQYPGALESSANMITQTALLPDVDNAIPNNVYQFNFAGGATNIPAHLPFSTYSGGVGTLFTIQPAGTDGSPTLKLGAIQIYINRNNIWQRFYSNTGWGIWYPISNREFVVTASDNLVEIVDKARNLPNAIVRIEEGDHDLYQEFMDFYGSDFFVNFTDTTNPKGLSLYNGMKLIGSANSKITFHYPGSNAKVKTLFSPITSSIGSWELDNVNIECSNCRYVVHDELAGQTIEYKHTYRNCHFKIDNTNNNEWSSRAAIGGGLGKNGEIEIVNNYFESYGDSSQERMKGIVTYHNANMEDAKSNLVVSGNYFANNDTFRIASMGPSTKFTTALVTNNSLGSAIQIHQETGYYQHDNVSVTEWNNIVRN